LQQQDLPSFRGGSVCFTLRLPLTSLRSAAFFCVTPSPDRLATPFSHTTNHADNSPSPAATTFQFHLQIPFLPIHSPIAIPLPRRLPPLLLLRWIPGTLSAPIPLRLSFLECECVLGSHSSSSSTFPTLPPHPPCHYPNARADSISVPRFQPVKKIVLCLPVAFRMFLVFSASS
jgi:hypothetical protein